MTGYVILVLLVLCLAGMEGYMMWSPGVLTKNKRALLQNNMLILTGVVLLVVTFWLYGFIKGALLLAGAVLLTFVTSRRAMKQKTAGLPQ